MLCYNNKMAIDNQEWRNSSNRNNESIYLIFRSFFLFHWTMSSWASSLFHWTLSSWSLLFFLVWDDLLCFLKLIRTFIHVYNECHMFCFCLLLCQMFCFCSLLYMCHLFNTYFSTHYPDPEPISQLLLINTACSVN